MQKFLLFLAFLVSVQDQEMNQRLPGSSLTRFLLSKLFKGLPYSSSNARFYRETLERIAAKLRKKKLLSRLLQSGRANDSPVCFEQAISLGSFLARAELALLWFNQNLAHARFWLFNQNLAYAECKKAFDLVKEGHEFGCSDCSGMLAHIYATGFSGVVARFDEAAYHLGCASAAAGSWFGKMALAHFLVSLLGPNDPDESYEDTFHVLWTDPFIQNFASPHLNVQAMNDVPPIEEEPDRDWSESWSESVLQGYFEDDCIILMEFEKRRIARHLIEEIQQEHQRNPNMPKVWLNLPSL
jgi:hypothetical protein